MKQVKSDQSFDTTQSPSTRFKVEPIPLFKPTPAQAAPSSIASSTTTKTGNIFAPPTAMNYSGNFNNASFLSGASASAAASSVFVPPVPAPSRFLTVARTVDFTKSRSIVPHDCRPTSPTKLTKLRQSATASLQNKFATIPPDDADEQIVNNYNLEMRISELRRRLVLYNMNAVFSILQFPPPPSLLMTAQPLSDTVDLLTEYDSVTEEDMFTHVRFLRSYGQHWDLQNIDWSQEFLHESCDVDLAK